MSARPFAPVRRGRPLEPRRRAVPLIFEAGLEAIAWTYLRGDFAGALQRLQQRASEGVPAAQASLGAFWLLGPLGSIDVDTAERCARRAHDAGSAHGTYVLAFCALARRHPVLALRWMREAAARDFPPAVFSLGRFRIDGVGATANLDEGLAQLRRAQRLGHHLAPITYWNVRARTASSTPRRGLALTCRLGAMVRGTLYRLTAPCHPLNNLYSLAPLRSGDPPRGRP